MKITMFVIAQKALNYLNQMLKICTEKYRCRIAIEIASKFHK